MLLVTMRCATGASKMPFSQPAIVTSVNAALAADDVSALTVAEGVSLVLALLLAQPATAPTTTTVTAADPKRVLMTLPDDIA